MTTKKQKRILIVEDESAVARTLQHKLEHSGFESSIATNGLEALAALKAGRFDAVLLDLVMSTMDGFAFLEEIKKQRHSIPIIIISNLGQEEDIARARALGVKEYFVKADTSLSTVVEKIKALFKY